MEDAGRKTRMLEEKSHISYGTILENLHSLHARKSTGVLVLMGIGQTARIRLREGHIVALSVQEKKGSEAIPLLPGLKANRMEFLNNLSSGAETSLPPTPEILAQLAAQTSSAPHHQRYTLAAATEAATGEGLDTATRTILEETLALHIGPMAAVLCDNILTTAQPLRDALKALAETISNPARAQRFLAEVQAKLKDAGVENSGVPG